MAIQISICNSAFKSIHFSIILCRLSRLWSIFNLVKNTLTDPSKLSNLGLHDIQRIYPINFFRFSVIKCDLNFRNSSNFSWFSAITWNNTIALHFEMLCMQHWSKRFSAILTSRVASMEFRNAQNHWTEKKIYSSDTFAKLSSQPKAWRHYNDSSNNSTK